MPQAVFKDQKRDYEQAIHKGELGLRDVQKEPEAIDLKRDQVEAAVGVFTRMVRVHVRTATSEGGVKSTDLSSLLGDAIEVTVRGEVEPGF